jgi:hypothetical protein
MYVYAFIDMNLYTCIYVYIYIHIKKMLTRPSDWGPMRYMFIHTFIDMYLCIYMYSSLCICHRFESVCIFIHL